MKTEEIIQFIKGNIEPLPAYPPYGERYRVAGTLKDGTYLPCIVIESRAARVDLAVRRFQETKESADPFMGYRAIVSSFVTKENTVDEHDIQSVSVSPYAISMARMLEINGETSMSWTAFSALMMDGKEFKFGTTFLTEFFEMPHGYAASDIVKITPAPRGERYKSEGIYRERPFFTCYLDGL